MTQLGAALVWRFGHVSDTAGNEITAWRHPTLPEPTASEIATLLSEYEVFSRKHEAKLEIDLIAEDVRQRFITSGAGMMLVYEQKRAEAERHAAEVAANKTPDPADFPFMNKRATRKGVSLAVIESEWLTKSAGWVVVAAQIEDLREGAKDDIDAVADDANAQENIDAIVSGISWPSL